eukprot:5361632-Amphidinium_carterae.2
MSVERDVIFCCFCGTTVEVYVDRREELNEEQRDACQVVSHEVSPPESVRDRELQLGLVPHKDDASAASQHSYAMNQNCRQS